MSRIQPLIAQNHQKKQNLKSNVNNFASKQSFNGGLADAAKALTDSQKHIVSEALIKQHLGWSGSVLNYLSSKLGEIQNLFFIGFGTAFVAPIFIAYNPIAKQDEKTKKYSAARQPISAVIATAVGLGVNIPVANLFNKWAAKGTLAKFDMSAKPASDFVKERYNSIIKHFDKLNELDKEYFDRVNDGSINSVATFKEKFGTYKAFETATHKKTLEKAAKIILDESNPDRINNQTVRDFLIKNLKFKQDIINPDILDKYVVKEKLSTITAIDFLKAFGFYKTISNREGVEIELNEELLRTFAKHNYYGEQHGLTPIESKKVSRLIEIESVKSNGGMSLKHLLKVLEKDQDFNTDTKLLNMKVDEFLLWLNEKIDIKAAIDAAIRSDEHMGAKGKEVVSKILTEKEKSEFLMNCAKNMAKNAAAKAETAFKAYSKLQGIILSLVTLPFACGALNWAYPRIMEKYFPGLTTHNANAKGGK